MVGQRIKVIEDNMAEFDVSSSMESSINELDARTTALAESARMMSDEDYDTLLHIVEAEAGTEDVKGRILVANVIMNRIKNKEFSRYSHRSGMAEYQWCSAVFTDL